MGNKGRPTKIVVGGIYPTKKSGMLEVIAINTLKDITIKFIDTGTIRTGVQSQYILNQKISDQSLYPLKRTNYKHGLSYDSDYKSWEIIMERCKRNPNKEFTKYKNYIGVEVSEEFSDPKLFIAWKKQQPFHDAVDFNGNKYQIDKDILDFGNRCYQADKCVYVPNEINSFFTFANSTNTTGYPGVYKIKTGFTACCTRNGKSYHLGTFKFVEDAFLAYCNSKEDHAKLLAEKWKHLVDNRVTTVLNNFSVVDYLLRIGFKLGK